MSGPREVWCGDRSYGGIRAIVFDKDGTIADSSNFLLALAQERAIAAESVVPGCQAAILAALGIVEGQVDLAGMMAVGSRADNQAAMARVLGEAIAPESLESPKDPSSTGSTGSAGSARPIGQDTGQSDHLAVAADLARQAFAIADQSLATKWGTSKARQTPPYADVAACWQRCQRAGVAIGIVSADVRANILEFLSYYRFLEQFPEQFPGGLAAIAGADDGPAKPDPWGLWQVCRVLGVEPAATLVVGDAVSDLRLARSGGAAGVIGLARADNHEALAALGFDVVIPSLAQLEFR